MANFMKPEISDKRGYDPRLNKQTIRTGKSAEVSLWGGGADGELLLVTANDRNVVEIVETESFKLHLRNFHVNSLKAGSAMLEARDDRGNVWAYMQIEVIGSVVAAPINATPSQGALQTTSVETQAAVNRLAAVSRKLRLAVKEILQHPLDVEYGVAANFFSKIGALADVVRLIAEQPGYRAGNAEGDAVRARVAPLKAKMSEITRRIETTVNLSAPLSATAPDRVSARADDALRLVDVLMDPKNADDINTVSKDRKLTNMWKDMFFNELALSTHNAMIEVLKTKHEDKIFDAIGRTLDRRTTDTMIGGIVWSIQLLASAGGNLPGPNSIYVSCVRIMTLRSLSKIAVSGADVVLETMVPHWCDALAFNVDESRKFTNALNRFREQYKDVAVAEQGPVVEYRAIAAKTAADKAQEIYDAELVPIVKSSGAPHSGFPLSAAMTGLNVLCLVGVWFSAPSLADFAAKDFANVALAGVNASFGIVATLSRSRFATEWAISLAESKVAGAAIGYFTAVISVAEGFQTIYNELQKKHADGWVVLSGTLQVGSGIAIAIGVFCSMPGAQLVGVVLGVAAGVVALIDEAATDKMVYYISSLVNSMKEARSTWDNKRLIDNLGLTALVAELEELVISCKVTELPYDRTWTGSGGRVVSKDTVHDRLDSIGIHDAGQRDKLIRAVWSS